MMRRFRSYPTIGGRRGGGIPADCVLVQYLRSTGTQYIDTGIVATPTTGAYWKLKCNTYNDGCLGMYQGSSDQLYIDFYGSGVYFRYGNYVSSKITSGFDASGVNEIELKNGSCYLNGTSVYDGANTSSIGTNARTLYIFARNNRGSAAGYASVDLYAHKIYDGSDLVADFVPVRRVENGVSVGYMCDRLTGELYGNAGTGAFVIGPDAGAWTNPYVTDGLVAMWDGEWNAGGGVHDDQLRLVDLSGNGHDMTFVGDCSLGSNFVTIAGKSGAYGIVTGLAYGTPSSQEMAVSVTDYNPYGRFIAESKGLVMCGGQQVCRLYGFGKDSQFSSINIGVGEKFSQSLSVSESVANYYFNGSYEAQMAITPTSYSGDTTFFNRMSGGRGITGNLYNIRFYSRALTATEIAANYAVDRERFGIN